MCLLIIPAGAKPDLIYLARWEKGNGLGTTFTLDQTRLDMACCVAWSWWNGLDQLICLCTISAERHFVLANDESSPASAEPKSNIDSSTCTKKSDHGFFHFDVSQRRPYGSHYRLHPFISEFLHRGLGVPATTCCLQEEWRLCGFIKLRRRVTPAGVAPRLEKV